MVWVNLGCRNSGFSLLSSIDNNAVCAFQENAPATKTLSFDAAPAALNIWKMLPDVSDCDHHDSHKEAVDDSGVCNRQRMSAHAMHKCKKHHCDKFSQQRP